MDKEKQKQKLKQIEKLKKEIDKHGCFGKENEKRVDQYFALTGESDDPLWNP